jgi:hypothetical protein
MSETPSKRCCLQRQRNLKAHFGFYVCVKLVKDFADDMPGQQVDSSSLVERFDAGWIVQKRPLQ